MITQKIIHSPLVCANCERSSPCANCVNRCMCGIKFPTATQCQLHLESPQHDKDMLYQILRNLPTEMQEAVMALLAVRIESMTGFNDYVVSPPPKPEQPSASSKSRFERSGSEGALSAATVEMKPNISATAPASPTHHTLSESLELPETTPNEKEQSSKYEYSESDRSLKSSESGADSSQNKPDIFTLPPPPHGPDIEPFLEQVSKVAQSDWYTNTLSQLHAIRNSITIKNNDGTPFVIPDEYPTPESQQDEPSSTDEKQQLLLATPILYDNPRQYPLPPGVAPVPHLRLNAALLSSEYELVRFKLNMIYQEYERHWNNLVTQITHSLDQLDRLLNAPLIKDLIPEEVKYAKKCSLVVKFEEAKRMLNDVLRENARTIYEKYKDIEKPRLDPSGSSVLRAWYVRHINNPYPSEEVKRLLAFKSDVLVKQVTTWFGNHRGRVKKKMISSPPETETPLRSRDSKASASVDSSDEEIPGRGYKRKRETIESDSEEVEPPKPVLRSKSTTPTSSNYSKRSRRRRKLFDADEDDYVKSYRHEDDDHSYSSEIDAELVNVPRLYTQEERQRVLQNVKAAIFVTTPPACSRPPDMPNSEWAKKQEQIVAQVADLHKHEHKRVVEEAQTAFGKWARAWLRRALPVSMLHSESSTSNTQTADQLEGQQNSL